MALQFSFVLLGLSLVLLPSVFTASIPTAKLTANFSQFSSNNPFPLKCTIDGVPNTYEYYVIIFNFNTANSTVNPRHESIPIALYVGTPHCQTCEPEQFTNMSGTRLKDYIGFLASAVPHQVYPEFEITISAQDSRAHGSYSCAVQINKIENDTHPIQYRSNEVIFK